MVRGFKENDWETIMKIWLDANITAHDFISEEYWAGNYDMVKEMLPQAEVYVYEDDSTNQIEGFIGLSDSYIAGLFVRRENQSQGIGKQILDYVKNRKTDLRLHVYQKNLRAVRFYQREEFLIESEGVDENTGEKEYLMIWKNILESIMYS